MNQTDTVNPLQQKWLEMQGHPENYEFVPTLELVERYDHPEFDGELYCQSNGPGTFQRILMVFPKKVTCPIPAVVVPFYFPEALLGFEPATGTMLPYYSGLEMMLHLVRRGFAAASADAFHLTYFPSKRERGDFQRWHEAAEALLKDHPQWTGIGKLTADTRLLTDALSADRRVNPERLGMMGHSLGGKMAFYAGCLDSRIRAICTSDFGIRWEQTNWDAPWYWGKKLEDLKARAMDHHELLEASASKPFCLIAGQADQVSSWDMVSRASGYEKNSERLLFLNHATGHRPPAEALAAGYDFLEKWL